jgi:hypothetical protein
MHARLVLALCTGCSLVTGVEARPVAGGECTTVADGTLQQVREVLFAPRCTFASSCHGPRAPEGFLSLGSLVGKTSMDVPWGPEEEQLILDNLLGPAGIGGARVGRSANNDLSGGALLVRPGDCEESFLWQKLSDHLVRNDHDSCPMPWRSDCVAPPDAACNAALACAWIMGLPPLGAPLATPDSGPVDGPAGDAAPGDGGGVPDGSIGDAAPVGGS